MQAWFVGLNQLAIAGLAALLKTLWYSAAVVALTWIVLRYLRNVNAATHTADAGGQPFMCRLYGFVA